MLTILFISYLMLTALVIISSNYIGVCFFESEEFLSLSVLRVCLHFCQNSTCISVRIPPAFLSEFHLHFCQNSTCLYYDDHFFLSLNIMRGLSALLSEFHLLVGLIVSWMMRSFSSVVFLHRWGGEGNAAKLLLFLGREMKLNSCCFCERQSGFKNIMYNKYPTEHKWNLQKRKQVPVASRVEEEYGWGS